MKALVLFAFLVALATVSANSSFQNMIDSYLQPEDWVELCSNKTGVNVDVVLGVMMNPEATPENLRKVYCFFACTIQHQGVMVGATLNKEKLHEIIDADSESDAHSKEKDHAAINKCTDQVKDKTDECEVTQTFMLCMTKEFIAAAVMNSEETTTETSNANEEQ